jgi:hypothetical protein
VTARRMNDELDVDPAQSHRPVVSVGVTPG